MASPSCDSPERVMQVLALLSGSMDPDEARVRRFLRARRGDIHATVAQLKADEEWRNAYIGNLVPSIFSARLAQRKVYLHGTNKEGMPLAVVLAGRHRNSEPLSENVAFSIHMLEHAIASMKPGVERMMVIVDCEGVSLQCLDIALIRESIAIMDRHYPERLGAVCVVDAPFICNALWSAVKVWLDQSTRDRVHFLKRKEARATLLKLVDAHCLPVKYGGTSKFDYDAADGLQHPLGLTDIPLPAV